MAAMAAGPRGPPPSTRRQTRRRHRPQPPRRPESFSRCSQRSKPPGATNPKVLVLGHEQGSIRLGWHSIRHSCKASTQSQQSQHTPNTPSPITAGDLHGVCQDSRQLVSSDRSNPASSTLSNAQKIRDGSLIPAVTRSSRQQQSSRADVQQWHLQAFIPAPWHSNRSNLARQAISSSNRAVCTPKTPPPGAHLGTIITGFSSVFKEEVDGLKGGSPPFPVSSSSTRPFHPLFTPSSLLSCSSLAPAADPSAHAIFISRTNRSSSSAPLSPTHHPFYPSPTRP